MLRIYRQFSFKLLEKWRIGTRSNTRPTITLPLRTRRVLVSPCTLRIMENLGDLSAALGSIRSFSRDGTGQPRIYDVSELSVTTGLPRLEPFLA